MKKRSLSVVVLAVVAVSAFGSTTVMWKYNSGVGLTPQTAGLWSEASNWEGVESAPFGADYSANFSTAHEGTVYVRAADGLQIAQLLGTSEIGKSPILLCDGTLTTLSNYAIGIQRMRIFGDWANPTNPYVIGCQLSGDILPCDRLTLVGEQFEHRLDRYANDTSAVRSGIAGVKDFFMSQGGYVLYAPEGCDEDTAGRWDLTGGSTFISRTGDRHTLVPGQIVTDAGGLLPAGTFVKRILSDALVELSAAPSDGATAAELTFKAFAPKVIERIPVFISVTNYGGEWYGVIKPREKDTAIFEIDVVRPYTLDAVVDKRLDAVGGKPGTIVFHDADHGALLKFKLCTCHVALGESAPGGAGMSQVTFYCNNKETRATLTVTNGVTATLGCLDMLLGQITKDGAGTLVTKLGARANNTGTLTVSEGGLGLLDTSAAGGNYLANLTMAAGTTLALPPSGLEVKTFKANGAVTVTGPGSLIVSSATDLSNVMFDGGACVRRSDAVSSRLQLEPTAPAEGAIGNPALWIDVSRAETMPGLEIIAEDVAVRRINDVRGAEYAYATAASETRAPKLKLDSSGKPHHLYFTEVKGDTSPADTDALLWDKPVRGIRAVFKVLSAYSGGGMFLGSTKAVTAGIFGDFMRPAQWSWSHAIVYNSEHVTANVRNGKWFVNSQPWDFTRGYAYQGRYLGVQVVECHPLAPGAAADCFGYCTGGLRNGRERLCECIVYTNELTATEREQVAGYLMKKWMGAEIEFEVVPENGVQAYDASGESGLDVPEGQTLALGEATGDGTFVKTGAGEIQMARHENAAGSLRVSGGTLTVLSSKADASVIPSGALLHLDASAGSSVTSNAETKKVTDWYDCDGGDVYALRFSGAADAAYPVLKAGVEALGGKPVIDFGPFQKSEANSAANVYKSALRFTRKSVAGSYKATGLHTAVSVLGSAQGGGSVVGETDSFSIGYGDIYGIIRGGDFGAKAADPILKTGFVHSSTRTRLNGEDVDGTTTGLSGGYDIVSLVTCEAFASGAIAASDYTRNTGGQELAEYFLFPTALCTEHLRRIEAYLRQKWFGLETDGFRPAKANAVTVESGATLNVVGAAMTVSRLSGAGAVTGALALADNATIEVPVAADGSVETLTVSGSIDLSKGGTVNLTGEVHNLALGRHVLVSCASIDPAASGAWSVVGVPSNREVSVGVVAGAVVMDVSKHGMILLVR